MRTFIRAFLFFAAASIVASCGNHDVTSKTINSRVLAYIQTNCPSLPCQIRLVDATDFSWDKFYVFETAVEDDEISKAVGSKFSSTSSYYSRKWFFLKDDRVFKSEERPLPQVDVPVKDGDVIFEMLDGESEFSAFKNDAVFGVQKSDLNPGIYYTLRCNNCLLRVDFKRYTSN